MYLGGLKKDIKKALKSGDPAKVASALAREQAKLDKAPNSKKAAKRADYVAQLQARLATAPTAPVAVATSTPVASNTPDIPMSFAPSGGGGSSGGIPMPSPDASDVAAPAPVETDYTPWLLGAALVLGGILYFKKKRG